MSHTERAGSDGIVQVEVMETGSGVAVQQTWTGGDGSMTGTVIISMIPYVDIGKIDLDPPTRTGDDRWTVRVQSAASRFPQTVNSPERKTARGTFQQSTTRLRKLLLFCLREFGRSTRRLCVFPVTQAVRPINGDAVLICARTPS
jgi:hypothetical protein